jgi:hypothetical protein
MLVNGLRFQTETPPPQGRSAWVVAQA